MSETKIDANNAEPFNDYHGARVSEVERVAGDAVRLVPTKSDADLAAELKDRIRAALAPVCALMDEAAQSHLLVSFMTGPNHFGKFEVKELCLMKRF